MFNASKLLAASVACTFVAIAPVYASIPVIDIAALQQLLQDTLSWQQQLRAMQSQLTQLQQTRTALTGSRGMERLLPQSAADRNYLPADWAALDGVARGTASGYADLSSRVRGIMKNNARLSDPELARLTNDARTLLVSARDAAATDEALTQVAYERSSARFASLGQLIDRIGGTGDVKAIAELQGRIAAEQAMLANEAVKLQSYGYAADAARAAADVSRREAVVHGHGSFASRFQPTPPAP